MPAFQWREQWLSFSQPDGEAKFKNTTDGGGAFSFAAIAPGTYRIVVHGKGRQMTSQEAIQVKKGERLEFWLELQLANQHIVLRNPAAGEPKSSGGELISKPEGCGPSAEQEGL